MLPYVLQKSLCHRHCGRGDTIMEHRLEEPLKKRTINENTQNTNVFISVFFLVLPALCRVSLSAPNDFGVVLGELPRVELDDRLSAFVFQCA